MLYLQDIGCEYIIGLMRAQVIWTILTMLLSRCNNVNQVYALRFFVGKERVFLQTRNLNRLPHFQVLRRALSILAYST